MDKDCVTWYGSQKKYSDTDSARAFRILHEMWWKALLQRIFSISFSFDPFRWLPPRPIDMIVFCSCPSCNSGLGPAMAVCSAATSRCISHLRSLSLRVSGPEEAPPLNSIVEVEKRSKRSGSEFQNEVSHKDVAGFIEKAPNVN
jgi:hypothetical protein